MPRYTLKNIRSNWSEESLFRAIDRVQNGNSLRKAVEKFKEPRTTLSRKSTLKGMEADLAKHVLKMKRLMFGLAAREVKRLAFQVKFVHRKHIKSF